MSKEELFVGWLNGRMAYYSSNEENFIFRLKKDLMLQVKGHFQREGWDKTYEWVKKQYEPLAVKYNKLAVNLASGYKECKDKMWSLEQKEVKK